MNAGDRSAEGRQAFDHGRRHPDRDRVGDNVRAGGNGGVRRVESTEYTLLQGDRVAIFEVSLDLGVGVPDRRTEPMLLAFGNPREENQISGAV